MAATVDELPLDEWIERAEDIGAIAYRYRLVSAEGEELILDFAFDTSERAYLVARADGAIRRMTVDAGILTQLIEPDEGQATILSLDFNEVYSGPIAWYEETLDALGMPEDPVQPPTARMSIWPAGDGEHTWNFDMSCGISVGTPCGWLARLEDETFESELVDDNYVVRLESGAELTLDATDGFMRRAVLDPEDESAGLLELLHVEVDPDLDAEPFAFEVPDDVEEEPTEMFLQEQKRALWRQLRVQAIRKILAEEADGAARLTDDRELLSERFGMLYTDCFGAWIEELTEGLLEWTDQMVDSLVEWFATNHEKEGARERLPGMARQIAERLKAECERGADAMSTKLVVAPFESDSADLETFLELEREGAKEAIRLAFMEPVSSRLQERLAEMDDD